MKIVLPVKIDGSRVTLSDFGRTLTVIGANGSGKTRFASRMAAELGAVCFRLSALHGLLDSSYRDDTDGSVDRLYEAMPGVGQYVEARTQFERMMRLLMNDEMMHLLESKLKGDAAGPTRLDIVIRRWGELFPGNGILVKGGELLFSRSLDSNTYSQVKLSEGEKAVMYFLIGVLFAPEGSVVMVDDPGTFLHPSVTARLWNMIECMRSDCTFVYITHDLEFAAGRTDGQVIWVREYDAVKVAWNYEVLPPGRALSDDIFMAILGARRPVLFIEGDGVNSIDAKLYPLVFKDYTVKSLGSCNKVIESVRTFSDLRGFHHLDSRGIVDRDRRDDREVEYLRRRGIMVPNVAEIENMLMIEEVVRAVARYCGRNEDSVFMKVRQNILAQFKHDLRRQALLHTRHRVKRTMECRVDGRFNSIGELEEHLVSLVDELNVRSLYESFCRKFNDYERRGDYAGILKVYNQKSMVGASNVAGMCGLSNPRDYLRVILSILKSDGPGSERIRRGILRCFDCTMEEIQTGKMKERQSDG